MSQSLSLIKQKPDSQKNILSDSSLQNGNIKIKFDSTTEKVQLMYKGQNGEKNIELGRFANTFGYPPETKLIKFDNNNVGIVIIITINQLGQSLDGLTLFNFNNKTLKVRKLCEVPEIAIHDAGIDTLSNIEHYDYFIDPIKKNLTVKEYLPYKSLDNSNIKYKTRVKEYKFSN